MTLRISLLLIKRSHRGRWLRKLMLTLALLCLAGCDRPPATPRPIYPAPASSAAASPALTATRPAATPTTPLATSTRTAISSGPTVRRCVTSRSLHYAASDTLYRPGHAGPTHFDCTGLVYRVFADCSATDLIGAEGEQPVRAYYDWFAAMGEADAIPPQQGDLIVYGRSFAHVAIYIGDGRAVSALLEGVREHDATELRSGSAGERMAVKAYLHIQPR